MTPAGWAKAQQFRFLAGLLVMVLAGRAAAQSAPVSIVVAEAGIVHSIPRDGYRSNRLINYDDCANDDIITFPLAIAGRTTESLEVWVGTGCNDSFIITSSTQRQCWKVAQVALAGASANNPLVAIRVRDIIAGYALPTGSDMPSAFTPDNPATFAVCAPTAQSQPTAGTQVTVFFQLVATDTVEIHAFATWTGSFKLVGPPPPDRLALGVGNQELAVAFAYTTVPADQAFNGFNFYCDSKPSSALPNADATGSDAGSPATCGETSPSQILIPGAPAPSASYECGNASKTSTYGTIKNLTNLVPYTVGIAAFDTYENVGSLSLLACQTPMANVSGTPDSTGQNVTCHCSFSSRHQPLPVVLLSGVLLTLLLRRLRARSKMS